MKDPENTDSETPDYKVIPREIMEKLELLELVVKESSDVIWIMDSNLQTTYMSPSVEKQLGYTVDEYSRLPLPARLPAESFELSQHIFQHEILPVMKGDRLADGKPIIYEMLHRHKNGQLVWGEISFSFIRDNTGKINAIMGITRNIHARKIVQEELARSREEFRLLVENTNDWVWKTDNNNRIIYSNPAAEKILGFPLSQILGSTPFDFLTPETTKTVKTRFEQLKESALPIDGFRLTFLNKNQRAVYLDVNGSPVFDSKGNLMGYQGIARDMSNYQFLINKVNRLEPFQTILLNLPDIGVIELDNSFEVLQWNVGAMHIFGYSRGEAVVGKIFASLWDPASWNSFSNSLNKNLQPVPGPFIIKEKKNKRKDSKTIQCLWYVNPVIEDEKLKSILIYVKDITEEITNKESLSAYHLFFDSFCSAAVFADIRLMITGFSPGTVNYFKGRIAIKNGMHLRKLFDREFAVNTLEKAVNHAGRLRIWHGRANAGSDSSEKKCVLNIISMHNHKGKLKGYTLLFDPVTPLHPDK